MEWQKFLQKTQNYPLIRAEDIFVGADDPAGVEVQLSRWTKSKKLIRLKRGVYLIASPFRKVEPFAPFVAATLGSPSYISLHKALEYYDLIPEAVAVYSSLTTKRPARLETSLGTFQYRHIHPRLFWGYHSVSDGRQTGFMAVPEKALLDYFYFYRGRIDRDYLEGMRLQNLDAINPGILKEMAERIGKPKVLRALRVFLNFREQHLKQEIIL